MLNVLSRWYQQRFSDPNAVTLFLLLVFGFGVIYFIGDIIGPLLVAIVLAYLLEWPVARLERFGVRRSLGVTLIVVLFISLMVMALGGLLPIVIKQGINLGKEAPAMFNEAQAYIKALPTRYPELVDISVMERFLVTIQSKLLSTGELIVKFSLGSLLNMFAVLIYLVLVPLLLFFLLKDKQVLLSAISKFMPRNRALADRVWAEMYEQIANYIRGKVIEIIIVGVATYLALFFFGLNYAVLLSVCVGLSVLIPYVGAVAVTIPVALVGLFQWGLTPHFFYMMLAYLVVQGLDGNLLVPILFSEAVNLHPVIIIMAVLLFGGLWGFWGVFFAIPLATLIKAVINVWPKREYFTPLSLD
ncbi:AI-2E family transporter [Dongshaea marina]|uniref:AI-2E family transporter n=1 Tax=Dongshaea marina TaxID=2047966 RepID=UPI000D3E81C3|nr:AI-2E family transporter [Dongshaea marina]